MPTSIDRFRSAVRQLSRDKAPGGVRYPAELRAAAVALARPRVRSGHAVRAIARDLGVTDPTLARWLRQRPAPVLRPVAVDPEPGAAAAGIVLRTAGGVRVDGLDRDALIAVLRALA